MSSDSSDAGMVSEVHQLSVKLYGSSGSCDTADSRFRRHIRPYVDQFDAAVLTKLLEAIESNSQTLDRFRAPIDHARVKTAAQAAGLDASLFPRFTASL